MAKTLRPYDEYLKRAQNLLAAYRGNVVFKPVFGAAAAYMDNTIFLTSGKFGVALKLPAEQCAQLIANKYAAPLKYFDKGHVKKNYAILSDATLADDKTIQALIAQSMEYCRRQV